MKEQYINDGNIIIAIFLALVVPLALGFALFYFLENMVIASILGLLSFFIALFFAVLFINKDGKKIIFEIKDRCIFYYGKRVVRFEDIKKMDRDYSVTAYSGSFNRSKRFLIIQKKSGYQVRLNLSSTSVDIPSLIKKINREIKKMEVEKNT